MDINIKETLEKQLQLLSERSRACLKDDDLAILTDSMLEICRFLTDQSLERKPYVPLK